MPTSIRIVEQRDDIATCMKIRWAVFVEEQGVSEEEEVDGEDDECSHVLAEIGDTPVGAARFRLVDDYVKIQRVCVPIEERGKDIGAKIIQFIVERAGKSTNAKFVRLGAQVRALSFYRRLGFREEGQQYLDAGILHIDMALRLTR